eukprot:CAMPEP_0202692730 /NCGR_PEP_ID=MMETSP1385-20130828/7037_1 /ASSEMBLY_ACC=CAM_ASM_000861 /TAXON_ID=933848 /ORGANISM="Elphidium margaritaceum" /LENGTH=287 /DNA_ID=CAMNT_0049348313 /DNA_START=13 /DNA_END=876 /DNA_ORIENTATION=+
MPFKYICSDPSYSIFVGVDSNENDLLARYMWPNDILFHVSNLSSGHVYLRTPTDQIDLKLFKKCNTVTDFFKHFKIPVNVIEECLHLTKASSIKGSKMDSVNIDITPWLNVEKESGTNAGTIHFKDMKYVTVLHVAYTHNDAGPAEDPAQTKQKKKKKKLTDAYAKEEKQSAFDDDFLNDANDDDVTKHSNTYSKKQWKKKLKALEKTKQLIDVKNVEKYLMQQQKDKNDSLKCAQNETNKKVKQQRKKERIEKKKQNDLENYVGVFDHAQMTSNADMNDNYEDSFM